MTSLHISVKKELSLEFPSKLSQGFDSCKNGLVVIQNPSDETKHKRTVNNDNDVKVLPLSSTLYRGVSSMLNTSTKRDFLTVSPELKLVHFP